MPCMQYSLTHLGVLYATNYAGGGGGPELPVLERHGWRTGGGALGSDTSGVEGGLSVPVLVTSLGGGGSDPDLINTCVGIRRLD